MAGGSETTQNTTQQQQGWAPVMSGVQSNVINPMNQWAQNPLQYTGQSYIGPTNQQQQGTQQQSNFLQGAAPGIANSAIDAWGGSLNPGQYLNAPGAMNPLNLYASQVGRNLDENIRPGYASDANMAGQYGGYSSRRHLNDVVAQRDASEAIANFGGNLMGSLWNQGLQGSQQAQAMAPQMLQVGQMPGQMLYGLGGQQRGEMQMQQSLDNQRLNFEQMEPYQRAQMYGGLVSPLGSLASSGESSAVRETKNNPNLLGMGMSAAMMAMGMPPMGGGTPQHSTYGTGGGGMYGGNMAPQLYNPSAPRGGMLTGGAPW